ncbi:MAG: hypothetical protein JXR76_24045 [Deltaproteobacteria bacterium]|nr:hypothetical protein [Deltaproteobacteria bacterium]
MYFEKAASLDANRPELHLLVAQAFFQTGDLQNTLTALKKGESSGSSLPSYYLFRGGVALQLSLYEEAWATFNMGYQLFPKEPVFLKELSVVMARAGLFATAAEYGDAYMKEAPHDVEGIVVIAHALLQNHQSVTAARILEGAVNTHPDNLELLASLAASYGQADKPLSAARILSRAAILNNSYAFDAAQYFIAAGKWREAMNMNLLVEKHPEKMSQRLRIFFQQGNFSRVTMMGAEMDKDEKRTDEDLYCLVYAWAQLGNVEFAASIAKQIKEKKKHNLAMEILKTISQNQ